MNAVKIAAIVLIVAGVLGLAYGSFSYTKETHEAKLGPIELSVKERQTVNVPVWTGLGAIVIGGLILLLEARGARANRPSSKGNRGVPYCAATLVQWALEVPTMRSRRGRAWEVL